jgi:hypothetical protein
MKKHIVAKNFTRIAGAVYSSELSESFNCKSQQDSGPSAGNAATRSLRSPDN